MSFRQLLIGKVGVSGSTQSTPSITLDPTTGNITCNNFIGNTNINLNGINDNLNTLFITTNSQGNTINLHSDYFNQVNGDIAGLDAQVINDGGNINSLQLVYANQQNQVNGIENTLLDFSNYISPTLITVSDGNCTVQIDSITTKGIEVSDNPGNNGQVKVVESGGSYVSQSGRKVYVQHVGLASSTEYMTFTDSISTMNFSIGNTLPLHAPTVGSLYAYCVGSTPSLYQYTGTGWYDLGYRPLNRVLQTVKDSNQTLASAGSQLISWDVNTIEFNCGGGAGLIRFPSPSAPLSGSNYFFIDNVGTYLVNVSLCYQKSTSGDTESSYGIIMLVYDSGGTLLSTTELANITQQADTATTENYCTVSALRYVNLTTTNCRIAIQTKTSSANCVLLGSASNSMSNVQISAVF